MSKREQKKIIVNGQETSIDDMLQKLSFDDGEIDFDTIGAAMDSDILEAAMSSFDSSYDMKELIERYLSLADDPIEVTT